MFPPRPQGSTDADVEVAASPQERPRTWGCSAAASSPPRVPRVPRCTQSDFVGRTDDEDSDPDDVTWVKPGPRRKPGLPIALSRGCRTPGRAGPTRTRVRDATSVLAGPGQQQQAAASVPADSVQPLPQGVAASDPPGQLPGVPRESASHWTWNGLKALKIPQLQNLYKENGIALVYREKKAVLITSLLQHRPAA
jgi:hypothetical protein